MSEPRTEAGRRLLEDLPLVLGSEVEQHGRAFAERITEAVERAILAIEDEAGRGVFAEDGTPDIIDWPRQADAARLEHAEWVARQTGRQASALLRPPQERSGE